MATHLGTFTDNGTGDQDATPNRPPAWDVEEALTWVTYGFFRHLKDETSPGASELTNWWDHLIAVQVAIGALTAECESISTSELTDAARQRLSMALSRIRSPSPIG